MTPELASFIELGKALTPDEREIAVILLQQMDEPGYDESGEVDDDQAEIDAEWDTTIQRRLDEMLSGKVTPVSGPETMAMGRALLAERRQQRQ